MSDARPQRYGQSFDLKDYTTGERVTMGASHSLPIEPGEPVATFEARAERWRDTLAQSHGASCAMIVYRWKADHITHADIILLKLNPAQIPAGFLRFIAPELAQVVEEQRAARQAAWREQLLPELAAA